MDIRFLLLLVCFFVSGFAGLVYETAWTREFAFVFGTSELAVSAVLAAYMAGLALGAGLAARLAPRLTRPILAYGVLELAIGLAALAVPFGIRLVVNVYLRWLGGLDAPPETVGLATALFHLLATFIVLVPCTALMGATLPLLARHAVRSDEQIGPRVGILYATNTAGAIAGTLTAAFVLLPELGLRSTVHVGVVANILVFGAAALLARRAAAADALGGEGEVTSSWILPVIAISGAVSFVYEVVWVRLLGFVLGGSTAAFSTMLASFLIGIALGSAAASRLARSRQAAAVGFVLAQLGTAFFGWGVFRFADYLPEIGRAMGASPTNLLSGSFAAILLLLPITICIGATFPFAVRLHAPHAAAAARASARVYAWNTIGSIVGSIAAGFFLLPGIGFEGAVLVGVLANVGLAVWTAAKQSFARPLLLGAAAAVAVLALVLPPAMPERLFTHSGLTQKSRLGALEFAAVGRSATVALIRDGYGWKLMTNGLPESTIERPFNPPDAFHPAQWLSLLPVLNRPDTKSLLVIGLGGGNTAGATTPGLESVDVIELEPEVVAANRRVANLRMYGDPLADPRVTLHHGDARGALVLTDREYDAIVSQPSHPWTSGASHLYTREFFELAKARLAPDGIFVQWIGMAFVDENLVASLLATLNDVFPHVQLYRPFHQALLFVSSQEPLDVMATASRAIASAPEQFARVGVYRPEHVAAVLALDSEGTRAVGEGAPLNTDDYNLLATTAWRIGDRSRNRNAVTAMLAKRDALATLIDQVEPSALMRRLVDVHEQARAASLIRHLEGAERTAAAGWIAYERGERSRAARLFERAFEMDPELPAARGGRVVTSPDSVERAGLGAGEVAVAEGLVRQRRGDAASVSELEPGLASVGTEDILYEEAVRLRVAWRIAVADPAKAAEALRLIDWMIPRGARTSDYVARVEAAAAAGEVDVAWATLARVRGKLRAQGANADLLDRAIAVARVLPERPGSDQVVYFLDNLDDQRGGVEGDAVQDDALEER